MPPLDLSDLNGLWRGYELRTGHPLDGLLEGSGWYGKSFTDSENVAPLLFGEPDDLVQIDPAKLPLRTLKDHMPLARSGITKSLFKTFAASLATTKPAARLRMIEYRHVLSAAMVYDAHPIIDHFRRIDDTRVLGLMDLRYIETPFFFMLEKAKDAFHTP